MHIGLYANPDKDPGFIVTRQVAAYIRQNGAVPVISTDGNRQDLLTAVFDAIAGNYADCDCIISSKQGSPLKGEATIDLTVETISASLRTPILNG